MGVFTLHFVYLALHNLMSIFCLSMAWLAHMHVSHGSAWHACACSVHNNFHSIK